MVHPDHVCYRRLHKCLFQVALAFTFFTGVSLHAEPLWELSDDRSFSGIVVGHKERVPRRAALKPEEQLIASANAVGQIEPTADQKLFVLTSADSSVSSRAVRRSGSTLRPISSATTPPIADQPAFHIPPQIDLVELQSADVVIDGYIEEAAWEQVDGFENMIVVDPDTLTAPNYRTLVRMFYTHAGLFVSADMEQPTETLVQRLSTRDQDLNRDGFTLTLDTSGQGLFGFWFGVNLGGSKEDGKVLPERNFSREWDGAWQGATVVTDKGWSAEMFIPWSIIAMPTNSGERRMNFFVSRKVAFQNERYGWPALPFTQARFMSALQPIAMKDINPKQQWEVFPYAATSADGIYDEIDRKVGVNFSWRPAPNMQVAGAVNPDFGAVESDDVVVNLTAYETYFPEKRFFFLEGSEVFETSPRSIPMRSSSRGARAAPLTWTPEPTTVLNTRRIGGSAKNLDIADEIDVSGPERSKPTELLGAVKVVGQAESFRFGLLGAFEDEVELRGKVEATGEDVLVTAPGRNFGVARFLWERQSGTGRQAHGYITTFADLPNDEAIVHGLDSHFLTQSGKWSIDTQLLHSDKKSELGYGGFADIRYTPTQGTFHRISLDYLDDSLDVSDLGFLRRNDLRGFRYTRFHNTSRNLPDFLRSRSLGIFAASQTNLHGDLIRSYLGSNLRFNFVNQSSLSLQYSWRPSLVDDRSSFGNGSFKTSSSDFVVLTFGTDSAKKFSYSVQAGLQDGEFGDPAYIGDIGFTFSPISRLKFDYDLRFRDSEGWVLHAGDKDFTRYFSEQLSQIISFDYFITARQQIRATLQWTGINATARDFWRLPDKLGKLVERTLDADVTSSDLTISRMTAQLRYRWEIAPLSDLFVVYTRGSNVPNLGFAEFDRLFREALREPIVDILILKLRYRFGS